MTEHDDGRIDLRALGVEATREDRVVAGTMARIAADPSRETGVEGRYIRPAIAAAALLVAAAIGTVVVTSRPGVDTDQPVAALATWAESQHIPTNGELLLAFQGYGGGR